MKKWLNRDMMKWWYVRMVGMYQYGFGVKWCNFFCFPNGEMVKSVSGVMVIWWNCPTVNLFEGGNFHRWRNGKMVKKINNTMNCMVGFNFCMAYRLCFSLLDFLPARQWWPSCQVWGSSHVLSLVSSDIHPIMSCHLSVFSNGGVV